jgi:glycosyltransferase 2 family protein
VIRALPRSVRFRLIQRLALLLAGSALGVLLIVLLLRTVDLAQVARSFSHVQYSYLVAAVPFFAANLLLKVPRWGVLFGSDSPDFDTRFGAINVGYSVNALLPARLGDIVRAYWIRDRARIGMVHTLSTIALERVLDGMALFLILLILAPTVALPGKLLGPALTVGLIFVVLLVAMIFSAFSSHGETWLSRWLDRLESTRASILGRLAREVLNGLHALRNRRALVLLVAYTAAIWISNSVTLWLVVRAFNIDVPLAAGFLVTAVLNLGMVVPSSPGYVGIFEYLMVLTLQLYGVHKAPALAATLTFHAIAFVPVTIIGLVYIARTGLKVTLEMVRGGADGADGNLVSESHST